MSLASYADLLLACHEISTNVGKDRLRDKRNEDLRWRVQGQGPTLNHTTLHDFIGKDL